MNETGCPFCPMSAALTAADTYRTPSGAVVRRVALLPTAVAILGNDQYYRGYTIVIARRHATELHHLPDGEATAYFQDMLGVAHAIDRAFSPRRMNCELLGNTAAHLHWHLFPRYADDPNPTRPTWEHAHAPIGLGAPEHERIMPSSAASAERRLPVSASSPERRSFNPRRRPASPATTRAASHRPTMRSGVATLLLGILAWGGLGAGTARAAVDDTRQGLARALAAIMLDEDTRRGLDEQVTVGMIRTIGLTLQERLSRRLLESEWRSLTEIVKRFVDDALPSSHAEEVAARVYARHFDEGELRELLRFQQSAVGQKAARLAPVIRVETAEAIDIELRDSAAVARLVEHLQREFPVLRGPESP